MAKLKLIGSVAVITSNIKTVVLKKLLSFKPESTKLKDEKENVVFAIAVTQGTGAVSKHGISFDNTNSEGFATVTCPVPVSVPVDARVEWAQENFGYALLNLNTLETQIGLASAVVDADFASMASAISVD